MTAAVDRLEQKGFLKSGPSPSDRRAKVLHLTPEGGRVVETTFCWHAAELESAMAVLNPNEKRELHGLLKKLGLLLPAYARKRPNRRRFPNDGVRGSGEWPRQ